LLLPLPQARVFQIQSSIIQDDAFVHHLLYGSLPIASPAK